MEKCGRMTDDKDRSSTTGRIVSASICLNFLLILALCLLWFGGETEPEKPDGEAAARQLLEELRSRPEESVLEKLRQLGQSDDAIEEVSHGLASNNPVVFATRFRCCDLFTTSPAKRICESMAGDRKYTVLSFPS